MSELAKVYGLVENKNVVNDAYSIGDTRPPTRRKKFGAALGTVYHNPSRTMRTGITLAAAAGTDLGLRYFTEVGPHA